MKNQSVPPVSHTLINPLEAEKSLEVSNAITHSAVMLSGKTESTLNSVKIPGIKMIWIPEEGLEVKVKGIRCLIPSSNFKILYFKD